MALVSPSKTSTLVRGGQATQHWWRMALQVVRFAIMTACVVYALSFAVLVLWEFTFTSMRIAFFYEIADMGFEKNPAYQNTFRFEDLDGQVKTVSAEDLFSNGRYRLIRDEFFSHLQWAKFVAVLPGFVSLVSATLIFILTGNKVQDDQFIRGAQLVSHAELKKWSKKAWKSYVRRFKNRKNAPRYTIADVQFPPDALEAQTAMIGTVGTGKTTAMIEMLTTIRKLGGRAVIYDRTGSFVSRFYDPKTDIIINPFDERSHSWQIFRDVTDIASLTQIAQVMIPSPPGQSDPFWTDSARVVLEYAARQVLKNVKDATNKDLLDAVINIPVAKLQELLASTPGSQFFNEEIEKTALSIRANMITDLRFLEFMRDDGNTFSVREWMSDERPSFLFLAADAEHSAAMRPIISSIAEIGVNALMSCGPSVDPKVFFFIDELASLHKMPFLTTALAQIRQFGGCCVLGYQVFSQLESVYGHDDARTIAGTVNNVLVFNTPDGDTADLMSKRLGSMDQLERTNNITVGAHEARDGTSFNTARQERPIVTASQIQNLPQLRCVLQFAYAAPTAFVDLKFSDAEPKVEPFVAYTGEGFQLDRLGEKNLPAAVLRNTQEQKVEQLSFGDDFYEWLVIKFPIGAQEWFLLKKTPPLEYQVYWPGFVSQRRLNDDLREIVPFIDRSADIVGSASNHTSDIPDPPWLSDQNSPETVSPDTEIKPPEPSADKPATSPKPRRKPTKRLKKNVVPSSDKTWGTFYDL